MTRITMPTRHHTMAGLWIAAVMLILAGCSNGGSGSSGAAGSSSTTSETPSTTQPSATSDRGAAFAAVTAVVTEASGLADKMYKDPAAAVGDPEHHDFRRYQSLFTRGATTPQDVEAQIRGLAADGQSLRASSSSGVFRETRPYGFKVVDADTVDFRVCSLVDSETVDASGDVVKREAVLLQGDGQALRERGFWHYVGVRPDDDGVPLTPGKVKSGFCDTVAATAGRSAG